MSIFQSIINHKINGITANELLKYAHQFQISISREEASQIANFVKGKRVNIFNERERTHLIGELAKITNDDTAKKVDKLLSSFAK